MKNSHRIFIDENLASRFLTLPEGEKDNTLDSTELQHGVEWGQKFPRGKVEQKESVESERDRDIVQEGGVQIATVDSGK